MHFKKRFAVACLSLTCVYVPAHSAQAQASPHSEKTQAEHGHAEERQHLDERQDLDEHKHSDEHEHADEHKHEHSEEAENIIVQATRSGRIADEEPIRVELINREEILEKATMRPGNISMLVAETGGVRVQTTSPALGSANIRLQGMSGRYTQLLADGLPLYGNQAASIGLLQIPPTDLGRVEIIKGSASSLYGGSALGGVINLVSRRPSEEFASEALINLTTRDGQDLTAYTEAVLSDEFQASFTAGAHHQKTEDTDADGWIDLPGYERYTARPRLFWQGDDGETLYATIGLMTENRRGGTLEGEVVANGKPFIQSQDSERFDGGMVYNMPVFENATFNARASAMMQNHEHLYGETPENDQHESYLLESSFSGYSERSDWLIGIAYQSEIFDSETFGEFDYNYEVPAVFGQFDYEISDSLTSSVSARIDDHSEYGTQFNPRVSLLYRFDDLTLRGSYGEGYYAPTPFVEEIEDAGLSRLEPLQGLEAEQAKTASIDLTYTFDNIETSLTLFGSDVENAARLVAFSSSDNGQLDRVRLINGPGTNQIRGSELLLRYYWHDVKLTASYLYLDSSQQKLDGAMEGNSEEQIALTPEHSAGFVAMWESHGDFRLGFEAYYTGVQRLDDNPYIEESRPYWHLGLMGEITKGKISYFINLENLLDVKQSDEHPLLLPARAPSGRWTTDIWSRNDGFIINGGIRIQFGE